MIERTEILLGLLLILVLSGVVYIGFNRRFDYAVARWEMTGRYPTPFSRIKYAIWQMKDCDRHDWFSMLIGAAFLILVWFFA
jgi:hypothetical protein